MENELTQRGSKMRGFFGLMVNNSIFHITLALVTWVCYVPSQCKHVMLRPSQVMVKRRQNYAASTSLETLFNISATMNSLSAAIKRRDVKFMEIGVIRFPHVSVSFVLVLILPEVSEPRRRKRKM